MDRGTEARASSRWCPAARSSSRHPLLPACLASPDPGGSPFILPPWLPPLRGKGPPARCGVCASVPRPSRAGRGWLWRARAQGRKLGVGSTAPLSDSLPPPVSALAQLRQDGGGGGRGCSRSAEKPRWTEGGLSLPLPLHLSLSSSLCPFPQCCAWVFAERCWMRQVGLQGWGEGLAEAQSFGGGDSLL